MTTTLTAPALRHLCLFSGRSHPGLAARVAEHLGVSLSPLTIEDFASGETLVRVDVSVRGCDVFVLQSSPPPVNEYVMESLLVVDALKRAGASSITMVVPFYPYARQDKKGDRREALAARLMADLYAAAGVDRVMSLDLHTDQIQGLFNGPVDHLHAMGLLCDYVASRWGGPLLTVVSPDAGRVKVAERWTDRLDAPLAILHKRRDPSVKNVSRVLELVGDVSGRVCVLVDDMIDTAGTITQAAEALREAGAQKVVVVATHAVLSDPARDRLASSCIDHVVVTDTLPVLAPPDDMTVLSVAPLIAHSIREAFECGSVTHLFEGQA